MSLLLLIFHSPEFLGEYITFADILRIYSRLKEKPDIPSLSAQIPGFRLAAGFKPTPP